MTFTSQLNKLGRTCYRKFTAEKIIPKEDYRIEAKPLSKLALENQFKALTGGYEAEKQELLTLSGKLEQEIIAGKDTMLNADR